MVVESQNLQVTKDTRRRGPTTGQMGRTTDRPIRSAAIALRSVKLVHTIIWAFFAACILAIPVFAWVGKNRHALVFVEVLVLVLNG